jgi:uncharacterized membrane protein YgcG
MSCPHCRLSLRKLDLRFGVAPKHFSRLTDGTLKLSSGERRKLRSLLDLFSRKFPQTALSVFLTELPAGTTIGEYSFWLANRVRFSAIEATGENNFDLLLVVDVNGAACLTVGYGLEKFVSEEVLRAALDAAQPAFEAKDWTSGIELCIAQLVEEMKTLVREATAEAK